MLSNQQHPHRPHLSYESTPNVLNSVVERLLNRDILTCRRSYTTNLDYMLAPSEKLAFSFAKIKYFIPQNRDARREWGHACFIADIFYQDGELKRSQISAASIQSLRHRKIECRIVSPLQSLSADTNFYTLQLFDFRNVNQPITLKREN